MSLTADPHPVTFAAVSDLALSLPGVEQGTAYGTPAFRVRGRFLARLHDDGDALVLRVDPVAREVLVEADPITFSVPKHYRGHPYVLVRLSTAGRAELRALFTEAWRGAAPKGLVKAYDDGKYA